MLLVFAPRAAADESGIGCAGVFAEVVGGPRIAIGLAVLVLSVKVTTEAAEQGEQPLGVVAKATQEAAESATSRTCCAVKCAIGGARRCTARCATQNSGDFVAKRGCPAVYKRSTVGGSGSAGWPTTVEAISWSPWSSSCSRIAFGNPAVYMEKFLEHPRHIEIQIIDRKSVV